MIKLNLLIADPDQAYAERLTTYINSNASQRFRSSYVTTIDSLEKYLDLRGKNLDIVLVSPYFSKLVGLKHEFTTVLLSDGRINILDKDKYVINKFIRGDLMVSNLIEIYTKDHPEHIYLNESSRKTKSVAVFSPLGGVGKSIISAGSSITAQKMGSNTFYLNLEDSCSTECFFNGNGFSSISELIYYLKEKKEQLHMKIDGITFKDPLTGVRSIAPPESLSDIAELTKEEAEELILAIMQSNNDLLFIDLSNQLSPKNLKALELVDEILLITSPNNMGVKRMNQFLKQITVMEQRKGISLMNKIHFIENNHTAGIKRATVTNTSTEYSFRAKLIIDYDKSINDSQGIGVMLNGSFGRSIQEIVSNIIDEIGD